MLKPSLSLSPFVKQLFYQLDIQIAIKNGGFGLPTESEEIFMDRPVKQCFKIMDSHILCLRLIEGR